MKPALGFGLGHAKHVSKILVHLHGLVRSPDKPGSKKGCQEHNTIHQLGLSTSHVALVEVPMEVQERRRYSIEDERHTIVIGKRTLGTRR